MSELFFDTPEESPTEFFIEEVNPSDEAGHSCPLGCCDYAFYDVLDCMDED